MARSRKPRQSDDVKLTFTGRVVYVHPTHPYIVLKDKNGVQTQFTWFSDEMAPEIEFIKKES